MNDTNARTEVIAGLRAYADLLEEHPGVPAPEQIRVYLFLGGKDVVVQQLAAFARAMPKVDKAHDDNYFTLEGKFRGLEVEAIASRSTVCEKRTVTKTVEDWVCPDSLSEYAAAVDAEVPA